MRKAMCVAITGYQRYISPWLPPHCRYEPSCSQYMFEAIQIHGARRGLTLGLKRLSRCNPLGAHGYDPVPTGSPPDNHKSYPTKEASSMSCVENIKTENSNRRGSFNG